MQATWSPGRVSRWLWQLPGAHGRPSGSSGSGLRTSRARRPGSSHPRTARARRPGGAASSSPARRSGGRPPRACRRTPRRRAASASRRTEARGSPGRARRRRHACRCDEAVDRLDDAVVEELRLVDPDRVVAAARTAARRRSTPRTPRASWRRRARRRGRRRSGRRSAASRRARAGRRSPRGAGAGSAPRSCRRTSARTRPRANRPACGCVLITARELQGAPDDFTSETRQPPVLQHAAVGLARRAVVDRVLLEVDPGDRRAAARARLAERVVDAVDLSVVLAQQAELEAAGELVADRFVEARDLLGGHLRRQLVRRELRGPEDLVCPGAPDAGNQPLVAQQRMEPARVRGEDAATCAASRLSASGPRWASSASSWVGPEQPDSGALLRARFASWAHHMFATGMKLYRKDCLHDRYTCCCSCVSYACF